VREHRISTTIIATVASVAGLVARAQPVGLPHTIYVNATVVTMGGVTATAEAVAVRDDRIVAVGSNRAVRATATSVTRVVDLQGRTMLPGFIDAHSHFPSGGINALFVVNLSSPPVGDVSSIDDVVATLRKKASGTPAGEWIRGAGYDQTLLKEGRHPTRADLDKASSQHPILITHASGHLAVANSVALRLAEVVASTPNPASGVIQRDSRTKEPNGVFEENWQAVSRLVPAYTDEQIREAIQWTVRDYASSGVTTATIAGGGVNPVLQVAVDTGAVPLRLNAMSYDSPTLPPARPTGSKTLRTGRTVKLVADGSIQGYTGYLSGPYHVPYQGDRAYRGYPRESREALTAQAKRLNRLGYQLAIHANGDAAIDDVLVAYGEALKDFPRSDTRFRIEHAQMTRADQLDTMKALGVSPSFFVSHAYFWGDQHRDMFMGPERAARLSPLASARRRGIRFSIHLDTPVTPMRPLHAVWSAVNRLTRSARVVGPDERLAPAEALRAITIDAAWQSFDEANTGSIEPGKLADFVVLDENPLTTRPARIKDIKILETIVGGTTMFSAQ
jgi:predicted amidohydrolase YtcJ